jgi:hypothetical protein
MGLLPSLVAPGPRPFRVGDTDDDFARDGLVREPAPREDGLRVEPRPGTFEWWYFDFHLEDGTVVVVNYLTKPMSRVEDDIRPHVKITITPPDGPERRVEHWEPAAGFRASSDACDLAIGPCTARGDLHRYAIHAEATGVVVDLELEGVAPPWRPGAGKMLFGEAESDFFGWMVPVPFGRARGRISLDGVARDVRGTGYHDHNYGNVAMSRICDSWWWSRTQVGDYTVIGVELVGAKAYGRVKRPVFMVAKGDRLLADDGSKVTLQRLEPFAHPSGKTVSARLVFRYRDDALDLSLELRRRKDIYALDLLDYVPRWKAVLARLAGFRPWYLRFLGDARLDLVAGGLPEHHESEAVYELMAFGPTPEG